MKTLSTAILNKKTEEQLKDILSVDLGYTSSIQDLSKEDLIKLIQSVQKSKEQRETHKFDFLNHFKEHVPLTEQVITDAFYSSCVSFCTKYFKESSLTKEQQKDIWYEIRDIVMSNNFKVYRPNEVPVEDSDIANDQPVTQKTQEKAVPTKQPAERVESVSENSDKASTQGSVSSSIEGIDLSALEKKGDKVSYIIDLLISEGDTLEEIRSKHVMNKYSEVFTDSVSDGYAYDKLAERKKVSNK